MNLCRGAASLRTGQPWNTALLTAVATFLWPLEVGTAVILPIAGYALVDCFRHPDVNYRQSGTRGLCMLMMFVIRVVAS